MNKKSLLNVSKYMSYILRHNPTVITDKLEKQSPIDEEGFVFVEDLLKVLNIDFDLLKKIVFTDNKQRYSFNYDFSKIRANQGHSIDNIEIQFEEVVPTSSLFHGTSSRFLNSILKNGLKSMSRNFVHLSDNFNTAVNVGKRHGGELIIFEINVQKMLEDRFKFYLSENGVYLIKYIPSIYLKRL